MNCVKDVGNTLSFEEPPVGNFNLTVHLRRGGVITTTVDMKKIVKPRSPSVRNVTFHQESDAVFVHVSTPYVRDYLTTDNQLFQLRIWSSTHQLNMTSETVLKIDLLHLHRNTQYFVKVRAIPLKELEGVWSEWSNTYTFRLPEGEDGTSNSAGPVSEDVWDATPTLTLGFVSVVVVIVSLVIFWKKKIFTYMWPNIPHPKDTLVHLCKPNKHLLLNFNPEVYSALRVAPLQTKPVRSDPVQSTDPGLLTDLVQPDTLHLCSTQSSDCRSTTSNSTEESELAALLDRSCSDGENSLQSTGPSSLRGPDSGAGPGDSGGSGQQEEAYVTMSSFYQSK
uniref:Fibronectin type-III domain-containing protein n=1 Tax=Cynoglossus semilaevis TaxID=244447 RepID=A0A3P8X4E8_CYNSE